MIDTAALLTAAVLFGGMVGFSFLFAPLIFMKLPGETAGGFIRQVFPWYYLFVLAVSGLAAALLFALDPLLGSVMALVAAGGVAARQVLMPAINRYRDRQIAGDQGAKRWFDTLHRSSVVLNFVQMIAAGWVLAQFAA
ncbi:MAG: DUF4149 domain-containing protein [Pseudomonadota bacterium]